MGKDSGMTIFKNIVNSVAPSILADSSTGAGMVVIKKVLIISTIKPFINNPGTISAATVFLISKIWV
ncbi:hypothetical protein D3C76_1407450 [compost metagenome]